MTSGSAQTVAPLYPTLPAALLANVAADRDKVALRYVEDGTWFDVTWNGYKDAAMALAVGLRGLGLERGDRVAILSNNRFQWLISDLACQCLGVVTAPIYPNSIPSQVQYILEHAECRMIFCEDRGQLAKVREVWDECPALERVVLFSAQSPDDERVLTFDEVRKQGELQGLPAELAVVKGISELDPDAPATIIYTSGTTGPPKGAVLSQTNMVFMAETISRVMEADGDDSTLSFLPLSHVAERIQGQMLALRLGYTVNIGAGIATVAADLRQVQPTILLCVPRLWEKMKAGIEDALEDAPELRRKIFTWALAVGREYFSYTNRGERPPLRVLMQHEAARTMVVDKIRARLGLARARIFASGAAPLAAEVADFFSAVGVGIQEVYGQTECTGVATFNPRTGMKFGTVGRALEGVDVRLAPDTGEILVRGPNVFLGYLKNEQGTAETVVDGWLHTGDVGTFDDDGYLRITDRIKDIIVTAGGKNVSPQNIEGRLTAVAGFSRVVVVGDKRKFLSALVTLERDSLEALWKREDRGVLPEGQAMCDDKDVRAWVQGHIDRVNADLARYEQIKKFVILPEDFTVESGELTASLKVKRRVVQDTYKDLIDRFYGE